MDLTLALSIWSHDSAANPLDTSPDRAPVYSAASHPNRAAQEGWRMVAEADDARLMTAAKTWMRMLAVAARGEHNRSYGLYLLLARGCGAWPFSGALLGAMLGPVRRLGTVRAIPAAPSAATAAAVLFEAQVRRRHVHQRFARDHFAD